MLEPYDEDTDKSTEDSLNSTLSPRIKKALKVITRAKSPRADEDSHNESPPKSQRTHSQVIDEKDPYLYALDQLEVIKATMGNKLEHYYTNVKRNIVHSKHILAQTFHTLLPELNLKSFIICTLWLQTPYDEGEFKSILEYALYQYAHLDFEETEGCNSIGEDDEDFLCQYRSEPSPYQLFLQSYPNPDDRNSILLSKLHTRFPELLSADIEKERLLNSFIVDKNDDRIDELLSDRSLIVWEIKMKTIAHITEFIKKCVLDKTYKVTLAAANSPLGKFFMRKSKTIEKTMNDSLDTTRKNLNLALRFMHLLTQDLPEDDFQEALNGFLLEIQADAHIANSGLIQIYANFLVDIKHDHNQSEKPDF